MKTIILGMVASVFFATTFVLNRAMDMGGGSWIWSATLRYVFMFPLLLVIVVLRGNLWELVLKMKEQIWAWLIWSTIGFGVFYTLVCLSAAYGPSWLVASTWQITIVAGSLLAPFFHEVTETTAGRQKIRSKIPLTGVLISLIILAGVAVVHLERANHASLREILLGVLPVLVAAFAYPLGNRKMMVICSQSLDTFQRVLGMTIASMPFWAILSVYGINTVGLPGKMQVYQSIIVAVFSGVVATVLFFKATELTGGNMRQLAAVEATQAGEVIFALAGELLFLNGNIPTAASLGGLVLIVMGIILHSYFSHVDVKNLERTHDNAFGKVTRSDS